jgi:cold shock CspA family protein
VATGTVAFWHGEDGWGAVKASDRAGVGFVHFSKIRGIDGYRELTAGDSVEFEWADDFEQDGCQ